MMMAIPVMLVLLVLLFSARPAQAEDAGTPAPAAPQSADKPSLPVAADDVW